MIWALQPLSRGDLVEVTITAPVDKEPILNILGDTTGAPTIYAPDPLRYTSGTGAPVIIHIGHQRRTSIVRNDNIGGGIGVHTMDLQRQQMVTIWRSVLWPEGITMSRMCRSAWTVLL